MDDLDAGFGLAGDAVPREAPDGLPFPTEDAVGLIVVPAPPVMPDLPPDRAVRYLMRLYSGWCRTRFNGGGRPIAQGATARLLADAAQVMRRRALRPGLWLLATEGAWRAVREAAPAQRAALHPSPGWAYSPTRLASYRPAPDTVHVPQRRGHPYHTDLAQWRRTAVAELDACAPTQREGRLAELRAEYARRLDVARSSVAAANALNARLADDGEWLWG